MMHRMIMSLALLFCLGVSVAAQKVEIITFEQLQARITSQPQEIVIYNFWATWCKPCVEEMPAFEKLAIDYKTKGVAVVFVSMDFKSKHSKVVEFVAQRQLQNEVVLLNAPDYNAWIDKVSLEWSGAIPATLAVKKTGNVHSFHEGSFTYDELVNFIEPLLK